MNAVLELLHTCLGVCGCFCLDEDFWQGRSSTGREGQEGRRWGACSGSGALLRPRPQAFREVEEHLLQSSLLEAEAAGESLTGRPGSGSGGAGEGEGRGGGSGRLSHAASSGSEEMYRKGSFNTKVTVLKGQSPFYRAQHPAGGPGGSSSSCGALAAAGAGGAADIELKPTHSNMLLGQQHLEARGKFVAAHPVKSGAAGSGSAHTGSAVRRGASPQLGAAG